jgi:hypothetical protein
MLKYCVVGFGYDCTLLTIKIITLDIFIIETESSMLYYGQLTHAGRRRLCLIHSRICKAILWDRISGHEPVPCLI